MYSKRSAVWQTCHSATDTCKHDMKTAGIDTNRWETATNDRGHLAADWLFRRAAEEEKRNYPHNWLRKGTTENRDLQIQHLFSPLFSPARMTKTAMPDWALAAHQVMHNTERTTTAQTIFCSRQKDAKMANLADILGSLKLGKRVKPGVIKWRFHNCEIILKIQTENKVSSLKPFRFLGAQFWPSHCIVG